MASIRALGIINPPQLISKPPHFHVVAGYRRIDACRELGMPTLECRILPTETDPRRCAMIAVADNAGQRDLDLIEQANAICLLHRFHAEIPPLVQAAQECGLSVNGDMAGKLLEVGRMSPDWQRCLLDGSLAFPVALQLSRMTDRRDADAMVQMLAELRIGLNRQREMVDRVGAIARRDGLSMAEVLGADEMLQLRSAPDTDRQGRARLIREHIRRTRYPTITQYEARYARTVKSLKLEKGTQLIPPAHFEGQAYTLKIVFKSPEDLARQEKGLRSLSGSKAVRNLWSEDD